MTLSPHTFVAQLTDEFPDLRPFRDRHLAEYDEMLPHVFFGDLTRWLVDSYLADPGGRDGPDPVWRRLLDRFEQAYGVGDAGTRELLYASFLENLPYPGEPGEEISRYLGPSLGADLADFR